MRVPGGGPPAPEVAPIHAVLLTQSVFGKRGYVIFAHQGIVAVLRAGRHRRLLLLFLGLPPRRPGKLHPSLKWQHPKKRVGLLNALPTAIFFASLFSDVVLLADNKPLHETCIWEGKQTLWSDFPENSCHHNTEHAWEYVEFG